MPQVIISATIATLATSAIALAAMTTTKDVGITINPTNTWGPEVTLGTNYGVIQSSGNILHAVYGDASGTEVHYRQSTDEGTNWTADQLIASNAVLTPTDGLAVASADVYVIYLSSGDVFLIHSANSGATWGAACRLSTVGNVYRVSLSATNTRVDVVWSVNASNGGPISFRTNTAPGAPCTSWGVLQTISGSSTTAVRPRVASFGSYVHVVWEAQDGGRPACYTFINCPTGWYVRSTNNGASFEPPQNIIPYSNPFLNTAIIPRPAVTTLPSSGNPVVTFHNPDPGDTADANQQIYSLVSSNFGAAGSWNSPIPAVQIPLNDSHPQMAGNGNTAYVLDSNTDLNTQFTTPWYSAGVGGTGWTPPEQVSTQNAYADAITITPNFAHTVYSPFSGGPLWYRRRGI